MLEAEEYGISSKTVDDMLKSDNPTIKRILGVTPGMGKALGVDEKWVYNIVKQVGNYGESFDRNVGMGSPLKIERGLNKLWTQVGLLNTLKVAVLGIVLSTILGTMIGVGRLSPNWLLARICEGYVEMFRNVPLLLWLFLIYKMISEAFPGPRQALNLLNSFFLSNR